MYAVPPAAKWRVKRCRVRSGIKACLSASAAALFIALPVPDGVAQTDLQVEGVIGGAEPMAIVDGNVVRVGERVGGATVEEIGETTVTFRYADRVVVRKVGEGKGEKAAPAADTDNVADAGRGAVTARSPVPPGSGPALPVNFVGRPTFFSAIGPFSAGTAFFLSTGSGQPPLVVTAHHIFGPAGGLSRKMKPAELDGFIWKIGLEDFVSGDKFEVPVRSVVLKGEKQSGKGSETFLKYPDLAVFQTTGKADCRPVKLAERSLRQGDSVWLAARAKSGAPENGVLHEAKVAGVFDDYVSCRFVDHGLVMAGASGAPVLDAGGEIVGVYSGSSNGSGEVLGIMVPVGVIRRAIGMKRDGK